MPASASAARAASTPYSAKLRPHLPHSVMPTPATTASPAIDGPPLPHHVLVVVVGEQRLDHELDLGPHLQRVEPVALGHLAQHDDRLGCELDRRDGERLVRLA